MRILHVLSSPHLGGAEVMCLQLAKAQLRLGHEVALHLVAGGETLQEAVRLGLDVRHPEPPPPELARSGQWEHLEAGLRSTVLDLSPTLVHSHVPKTNLLCHRVLRKPSTSWVATIHGSWRQFAYSPEAARRPILKPWLLLRHAAGDYLATRSAGRIVAISDYVKRQLRQVGVASRRIRVVHDGLEFAPEPVDNSVARRDLGLPMRGLLIGSLGHLAPVKGFDLLIDALARIGDSQPDLSLVIAGGDVLGDPTVRNRLRAQAQRLGLADRVHLLGALQSRQAFFSALDLLAVASRTEGFSLALVEAMQHGLPSVVTSAGGCGEAARPQMESIVFRSGNIEDLARSLQLLTTDAALRVKLGSAARLRAQSYLTLDRCAGEYEQVYEEVNETIDK